jgi:uncharacterized membrane protein YeaQ/YmgE (transglycosylase-associated protein family)
MSISENLGSYPFMASSGPVEIEVSLGQPIQTDPQLHPRRHIMQFEIVHLLWFLLIGLAAGWLAGQILKGGGFGLWGDLIVGVIGALLGGFLFGLLGISAGGLLGSLITATVGAIILLLLLRQIKKA